jgi:hypothetical protein
LPLGILYSPSPPAISCTRLTILRRISTFSICMNAFDPFAGGDRTLPHEGSRRSGLPLCVTHRVAVDRARQSQQVGHDLPSPQGTTALKPARRKFRWGRVVSSAFRLLRRSDVGCSLAGSAPAVVDRSVGSQSQSSWSSRSASSDAALFARGNLFDINDARKRSPRASAGHGRLTRTATCRG